jgi:GR25 family glycosyltransferase involved in LPS biosynthesis
MLCHYINLDTATDRRTSVQDNFSKIDNFGWGLRRFQAITSAQVGGIQGSLTSAEKACFCSHRSLITEKADSNEVCMVAEDDVMFSDRTFASINKFLEILGDNDGKNSWDILFTEVCILDLAEIITLTKTFGKAIKMNKSGLLNLAKRNWFGASSYLINRYSLSKIIRLLNGYEKLDVAFDVFLKRAINDGTLKAFVMFPFVTTVSYLAFESQIQTPKNKYIADILNISRALFYVDRDMDMILKQINRIEQEPDVAPFVVGKIVAARLSYDVA